MVYNCSDEDVLSSCYLNPKNLDIIYTRSQIEVTYNDSNFHDIYGDDGRANLNSGIYYNRIKRKMSTVPYPDHTWVEVHRISTICMSHFNKQKIYDEGLSNGYPLHRQSKILFPYGCWFEAMVGTGVFVNIGRSVASNGRNNVAKMLKWNDLTYKDANHRDFGWCRSALGQGYDSIQIYNHFNDEIVICGGQCATTPDRTPCPPVPLRTGINASKSCTCDERLPVLNCGTPVAPQEECFRRKKMLQPREVLDLESIDYL